MGKCESLISVVVPVYNVEQWVKKCLDSIVAQTYSQIEIIVVDDASTDGSGSLCDSYAFEDRRLQIVHFKENCGPSAARNEGIRRALGKYITFIDADDYIETDMLEKLYENLLENDTEISICGYDYIGAWEGTNGAPGGSSRIYSNAETLRCALQHYPFGYEVWGKLYLAEHVKENFFDEKIYYGEDLLFFYQIGQKIKKVSYLSTQLYHHVFRKESLVHSALNKKKCMLLNVYEYLFQDASKKFPELEIEIRWNILNFNICVALEAVKSQTLSKKEIYEYLKLFQKHIRQHFRWSALSVCPYKKATAIILLRANKIFFWKLANVYYRYRQF